MKYYVQMSGCKATLLPELWYPGGFGFALPLHSPYKPYFDQTFVFYNLVITARKRSLRRLCFHRCLSVHRGVSAPLHAGYTWDQRQTPPVQTPPGQTPPG